jgi:hypothetical protein
MEMKERLGCVGHAHDELLKHELRGGTLGRMYSHARLAVYYIPARRGEGSGRHVQPDADLKIDRYMGGCQVCLQDRSIKPPAWGACSPAGISPRVRRDGIECATRALIRG